MSCRVRLSSSIILDLLKNDVISDGFRGWVGGESGSGKALALDTRVPTPMGWTTMGELRPGDVVFDERGEPCRVLLVSEVMHNRSCFELGFDTGDKITADGEHQWWTFDAPDRHRLLKSSEAWRAKRRAARPRRGKGLSPWTVEMNEKRVHSILPITGSLKTTAEIAATVRWGPVRQEANHSIKIAPELNCETEQHLPVDPYVLGVWLGDGTSCNGNITSADAFIMDELRRRGWPNHRTTARYGHAVPGLHLALKPLGVIRNKHIPPQYLRAGREQRLELLRGLMDTDGHATKNGRAEFTNTNYALATATLELIRSLGHKAAIHEGVAKLNGRIIGPKWRITWTPTERVFHLPRKATRQKLATRATKDWHYIVSARPVPPVPVRCIAVDSPSRQFLAGAAMVPTHNSSASALIVEQVLTQQKQVLILDSHGEYKNFAGIAENTRCIGYDSEPVKVDSVDWCIDILRRGESLIIDLSHWTDIYPRELDAFALNLMRKLYDLRRKRPRWMLVVIEEAQNLIPQAQASGQAENVRVMLGMLTGGRKYGIQFLLTSQRQSLVDVTAISACNVRLFLRVSETKDWDRIKKYIPRGLGVSFAEGRSPMKKWPSGKAVLLSRWTNDAIIRLHQPETPLFKPLEEAMLVELET